MSKLYKVIVTLAFLVIVVMGYILYWNYYHNKESFSLKHSKSIITSIASSPIDANNNFKLVYLNGKVSSPTKLLDNDLQQSFEALVYNRKVYVFQWEEIENKTNSNNITYHYQKIWADKLIDSSKFHFKQGHQNPEKKPLKSIELFSEQTTLGDFVLNPALLKKINFAKAITVDQHLMSKLESILKLKLYLSDSDRMICNSDISKPRIGDFCVEFGIVEPQIMSIIAQQYKNQLRPYSSPTGVEVAIIEPGKKSPDEMFHEAAQVVDDKSPLRPVKMILRDLTGF